MKPKSVPTELEPTEDEIREAMAEMEGFLDITPHDFSRLYHIIHSRTDVSSILELLLWNLFNQLSDGDIGADKD